MNNSAWITQTAHTLEEEGELCLRKCGRQKTLPLCGHVSVSYCGTSRTSSPEYVE